MISNTDKQALGEWEEYLQSIRNSTPVDLNESAADKAARMKRLEKKGNEEEWFKYYFPNYYFSEAADFHKKSTRKYLYTARIYQCRPWFRGSSKSKRRMFETFYEKFALKIRLLFLLISYNSENAVRLLAPYKANLEANQRLIHDYGIQERPGKWKEDHFITKDGSSFVGVGTRQNPRGMSFEEMRVNRLVFDDADDDEVCGNIEILNETWTRIEKKVIPTVEISADYKICWDNNTPWEDSLALRAQQYATDVSKVNIKDENGLSTWPEKNSQKDIEDIERSMSYESFQGEYMNNGMGQGTAFPEMTYGKCPPLRSLRLAMVYGDPSPSNKERPSAKSKAKASSKCVVIIGYKDSRFYIYTAWLDHTTNAKFVSWYYGAREYIANKTVPFFYVENNGLQNPFYEQVLLPLIFEQGKTNPGGQLPIKPDGRDKPDKWTRIEGTLEPLNRLGQLIINIDEKDNPHIMRLVAQFKAASAKSKLLDGPDAVEGGVFLLKMLSASLISGVEGVQSGFRNPKRY